MLLDLSREFLPLVDLLFIIAVEVDSGVDIAREEGVDEGLQFMGEESGRTICEKGKGKDEMIEDESEEGKIDGVGEGASFSLFFERAGEWWGLRKSIREAAVREEGRAEERERGG